jgi:kumamolisin
MKQTIYLKPAKFSATGFLWIAHMFGRSINLITQKSTHLVIDSAEKLTKKSLPAHLRKDVLAIVPEGQGKNRYRRVRWRPFGPKAVPLTPAQVAKAYNFPKVADCSKQCIALIELGGSINPAMVAAYCKAQKITPPTITTLNIDGATEVSDGPEGADGEVSLDACVIAGICPGIQILCIFAPNTDQGFADAVIAAANHPLKPCAISISWGAPEDGWLAAMRAVMDANIAQAQKDGINTFAAAGDNGSSDGMDDGHLHVDYPASSPFSIACGGTKLVLNKDGSRHSEVVWQKNGATGGGMSILYSRPDYQKGVKGSIPKTATGRLVPDVAGNASPDSGYIIVVDGMIEPVGGTSGVAPLYSALAALLTATCGPLGDLHKVFYNCPADFFDVVSGNNGAFKASSGFDLCTGLGVANGGLIAEYIKSRPLTLKRFFR